MRSPPWNFKCKTRPAILDAHATGYPVLWVIVLGSHRYNKYNTVKYSCICASVRFNIGRESFLCRPLFRKASGLEREREREQYREKQAIKTREREREGWGGRASEDKRWNKISDKKRKSSELFFSLFKADFFFLSTVRTVSPLRFERRFFFSRFL